MSAGDAALAHLAQLKFRGFLRKRLSRLRRPANAVFAVIGLVLMGGWLYVLVSPNTRGGSSLTVEQLPLAVQLGALTLVVMTATSALSHRGLYLPPAEVELLLAAPVSRAGLVRYRVLSSLGRALFGGVVIGIMAGRAMPVPVFGFVGAFVATLFLPLIGQGISLLAGSAENRVAARVAKLPFRWINLLFVMLVVVLIMAVVSEDAWVSQMGALGIDDGVRGLLAHPVVSVITAPFLPWAKMMTAPDAATFLAWLSLNAVLWFGLFELVARIPIDFRELSLATSADIARRLRRHRRGAGLAGSLKVSKYGAARRVPWLFGRGPFGAIAWRKSCSILRKARGTLLTGAFIIGLLTLVSTLALGPELDGGPVPTAIVGPLLIAVVGTIYLCAGLRFDFREDLDQMELMKAWPVQPWRLFLATLVPEVVLVSVFVASGIGLRAVLTRDLHPVQLAVVGAVPLLVLLWTSIDNAVFLYAPIRYTPGQEGALHHTGRALILMLLRMVFFAVVSAGIVAAVASSLLLQTTFGLDQTLVTWLAGGLTLLVLLLELAGLLWVGGRMFRRFDVARDRG